MSTHLPAPYWLLLLAGAALGACSDEVAAPTLAPVPPRGPAGDIHAAGDVAKPTAAAFVYRPGSRRDPFRSYLLDAAARRQAEHSQRHLEETESYELSQYHLSGILTGTSQPKAMVEDPTGRGYVVRIGTRLGRAGGRVARIDSQGVQVIEESLDPQGRRHEAPITLVLPSADNAPPEPRLGATP